LKRRGITDVYLITDMLFTTTSIRERQNLNTDLKAMGFTVHGIMTPGDLAWTMIPQKEATELPKSWHKRFEGPEFIAHINENYPEIAKLVKAGYQAEQTKPGIAYDQAYREYTRNLKTSSRKGSDSPEIEEAKVPDNTHYKSISAKIVAEQFLSQCPAGYAHVKGLLLDSFLTHLPDWVDHIVFADDNDKVNNTIINFKPVKDTTVVPPITMLHIKGLSTRKWCDKMLSQFFKVGTRTPFFYRYRMQMSTHRKSEQPVLSENPSASKDANTNSDATNDDIPTM